MEWPTIITAFVAVYGAVLSTYTAIAKHRERERRVAVKMSIGFQVVGGSLGPSMVFLTASNPGARTVRLTSYGILLPDKRRFAVLDPDYGSNEFPCDLAEGRDCRVAVSANELARELKKAGFRGNITLRGFYESAVGTMYRSKRFKCHVDDWCRSASKASP